MSELAESAKRLYTDPEEAYKRLLQIKRLVEVAAQDLGALIPLITFRIAQMEQEHNLQELTGIAQRLVDDIVFLETGQDAELMRQQNAIDALMRKKQAIGTLREVRRGSIRKADSLWDPETERLAEVSPELVGQDVQAVFPLEVYRR